DLRVFEWYYLWRLCHTGRALTWRAHKGQVSAVAFSPDGTTMASGGLDRALKLWDVATGQERAVLSQGGIRDLAFSPDGKTLATADWGDTPVKVWDLGAEPPRVMSRVSGAWSVAFSPDGKTLATGAKLWRTGAKLWDAATGKERVTLQGHKGDVTSMAFSPDGKTLASASGDRTVKLWDVATGQGRA